MKKLIRICRFALVGLFILGASLSSQALAQKTESYIALEVNSGRVLYAHNAEKIRPAASLGHVATAIVALDWVARTKVSLNTRISVPSYAAGQAGSNPMKLVPGDKITLRDALYSTLLGSDIIASLSVAHYVGSDLAMRRGKNDPIKEFVSEMNLLASALGMTNTTFRSPHGLDSGKNNETTAADLALLGVYVMRNRAFSLMVSQPAWRIGVATAAGNKLYDIRNTNLMLKDPGVNGIKMGSSLSAGYCGMIGVERATVRKYDPIAGRDVNYPQRMVVVVLGQNSNNGRYSRCRELVREGWREFDSWLGKNMPRNDGEKRFLHLKNGN